MGEESKGVGSCKFPREEIMGVQKFNFAPAVPQYGKFSAPNLYFWKENLSTRRKFFDRLKFSPASPVTIPLPGTACVHIGQQKSGDC